MESGSRIPMILHVGPPKTASTSIQSYLFNNKERLIREGILYPSSLENASYPEQHGDLCIYLRRKNYQVIERYGKSIYEEAHDKKARNVIISSESFAGFLEREFWEVIFKAFSKFDIQIVFVRRAYWPRLRSTFFQYIEGDLGLMHKFHSIEHFANQQLDRYTKQEKFFDELGSSFFTYKELIKNDRFCSEFLELCIGKRFDFPEHSLNKSKQKFSESSMFWTYSIRKILALTNDYAVDSLFAQQEANKIIRSVNVDMKTWETLLSTVEKRLKHAAHKYFASTEIDSIVNLEQD